MRRIDKPITDPKREKFRVVNLDEYLNTSDPYESILKLCNLLNTEIPSDEDMTRFSEPQKKFLNNQWFEMEVNNGGIDQFFYNSSGELAHETVESLKSIAAFKTAQILQEGIDRWPNGRVPKNMRERREILLQITEEAPLFEDLDDRFYLYEEDLSILNLEYIRRNREEF